jgi:hypothetical protein
VIHVKSWSRRGNSRAALLRRVSARRRRTKHMSAAIAGRKLSKNRALAVAKSLF